MDYQEKPKVTAKAGPAPKPEPLPKSGYKYEQSTAREINIAVARALGMRVLGYKVDHADVTVRIKERGKEFERTLNFCGNEKDSKAIVDMHFIKPKHNSEGQIEGAQVFPENEPSRKLHFLQYGDFLPSAMIIFLELDRLYSMDKNEAAKDI